MTTSRTPPKHRCTAKAKGSGQRCMRPAIPGGTVCRHHGGAAPQVLEMARQRIRDAAPGAVSTLVELTQHADSDSVRRSAASDLLDRAGLKTATHLDVTGAVEVTSPVTELMARLAAIAERQRVKEEGAEEG